MNGTGKGKDSCCSVRGQNRLVSGICGLSDYHKSANRQQSPSPIYKLIRTLIKADINSYLHHWTTPYRIAQLDKIVRDKYHSLPKVLRITPLLGCCFPVWLLKVLRNRKNDRVPDWKHLNYTGSWKHCSLYSHENTKD